MPKAPAGAAAGLGCESGFVLIGLASARCDTIDGRTHIIPANVSPNAAKPYTTAAIIVNDPDANIKTVATANSIHKDQYILTIVSILLMISVIYLVRLFSDLLSMVWQKLYHFKMPVFAYVL